jgi:hypothetical protein
MDSHRRTEILGYMKQQWDDIHHSRNQDWKVLLIIIGIFSVLFVLHRSEFKNADTLPLELLVCAAGLLACTLGACIAFAHWRLFFGKLNVIRRCEHSLDIRLNLPKNRIPVQGVIFFNNFFLGSALIGWASWVVLNSFGVVRLASIIVALAIAVITLLIGVWLTIRVFHTLLDELRGRDTISFDPLPVGHPQQPLIAETPQLAACLELLRGRPIKLVAEARHDDETSWTSPIWTFQERDGHLIVKDLLDLPADRFQFSVANEQSRQVPHKHLSVFEIYISTHPMKVWYRRPDGTSQVLTVENGAILVPPTVEHNVTLRGLTFVVQCATSDHRVSSDKVAAATA